MRLTIQYFAILRDQRGQDEEIVETDAATPKELYQELKAKHGLALSPTSLKVALNEDFADWQEPLKDGDRVVFIPPVAGG